MRRYNRKRRPEDKITGPIKQILQDPDLMEILMAYPEKISSKNKPISSEPKQLYALYRRRSNRIIDKKEVKSQISIETDIIDEVPSILCSLYDTPKENAHKKIATPSKTGISIESSRTTPSSMITPTRLIRFPDQNRFFNFSDEFVKHAIASQENGLIKQDEEAPQRSESLQTVNIETIKTEHLETTMQPQSDPLPPPPRFSLFQYTLQEPNN